MQKSLIRLTLFIFMIVGLVACGGGLPQEAIDKLNEEMPDSRGTFSIVSAQKVADEYDRSYDEMWCVAIDPPVAGNVYNELVSGFVVYRRALLWEVDRGGMIGDIFMHTENSFLALGCTNYPK
ncbi:MAG TPA: hypothetical protein PLZ51_03905 [Aggregatilineales bacterium]|nr:hypothetical protein [Aggregatilineales bacterium]